MALYKESTGFHPMPLDKRDTAKSHLPIEQYVDWWDEMGDLIQAKVKEQTGGVVRGRGLSFAPNGEYCITLNCYQEGFEWEVGFTAPNFEGIIEQINTLYQLPPIEAKEETTP